MRQLLGVSLSCVMLIATIGDARAQQARPFHLQEATIAGIHEAFAAHQVTCTQLARLYLNRIGAYNLRGPSLHAVITVNPKAMERAAELDRQYTVNSAGAGPLHCIPVVLK